MTDIAKIRTGKVKGTMNSNNLSDYYYNHSFMERLRKRLPVGKTLDRESFGAYYLE